MLHVNFDTREMYRRVFRRKEFEYRLKFDEVTRSKAYNILFVIRGVKKLKVAHTRLPELIQDLGS